MEKNEGSLDRAVRILVGLGLLSLIVVGPRTLWGLIGVVPLLTGTLGYCPVYSILGMRTCPVRSTSKA